MATRRERVILELEDNFTSEMARAAAATALLNKQLEATNRRFSSNERSTDKFTSSVDKLNTSVGGANVNLGRLSDRALPTLGKSVEGGGRQIDRLSGRLALLAQAAAVLGPALIPLGAPLIGVAAGLTAQFAAVAGGVGVAVLAFKGMGDGLKAVNKYQLEPTAANLQDMRIEMEKLGPAGAEFVRYLDALGPQLSSLQMAAREGLLPGVTEGIDEMLTMLPRVQSIITDLAEAMGGLAGDAGADLAGPEWERFFRYLDTEAGPLLDDFGRTVGNFANGFANMLVGFGPLTDDFSNGLLGMSRAFAEWSSSLGSNDSFQGLLDYIAESGPKAVDFLGSLARAFGAILSAAAPVGDVVLPVLSKMLDIIGDLADSPLGPLFFSAAAGLSVYSRAAAVAAAATTRLNAANKTTMAGFGAVRGHMGQAAVGAGLLGLAYSDLDDKAGLSNTAMGALAGTMFGPWGTAIGAGIGLTMDLASANNDLKDAIDAADAAMRSGGPDAQVRKLRELKDAMEALPTMEDVLKPTDKYDEMGIFEEFGTQVADTFKAIEASTSGVGERGAFQIEQISDAMRQGGDISDLFGRGIGYTADQIRDATHAAQDFSGALAQMAGWLDKRAALRSYQEELVKFGKALENGFQPKNVEGLDRVAQGILQVAEQIKNVEVRKDFLANARESLVKFAGTGPKAEAAVQKVIEKFEKFGLMRPEPEVGADTKGADAKLDKTKRKARELDDFRAAPGVDAKTEGANRKFEWTLRLARDLDRERPTPWADLYTAGFDSAAASVRRTINNLDGDVATVTIRTVRTGGYGPQEPTGTADGGFVPKTGKPYADRHHYLLADGEGVTTNRHGETDRFRDVVQGINAGFSRAQIKGMLADGGFAGGGFRSSTGDNWSGGMGDNWSSGVRAFNDDIALTGVFLHNELKARQALLTKEQEAGKARLDMLRQEKQALEDSIKARFSANPWGQEQGATGYEDAIQKALDANDVDAANALMAAQAQATAPNINSFIAQMDQQNAEAEEFDQLRKQLMEKGFNGPAFKSFLLSASVEEMRALATGTRGQIDRIENSFEERGQRVQQAASGAGRDMYGGAIKAYAAEQKQTNAELRLVRRELEDLKELQKKNPRETGREIGAALDGVGAEAKRNR